MYLNKSTNLLFFILILKVSSYEIQEFEHEFEDFPYFRVGLSCNLTDIFPQIEESIQLSTQRFLPQPTEHKCNCTCEFDYKELISTWDSTLIFSIIPSVGTIAFVIYLIYTKWITDSDEPSVSVQCLNCENTETVNNNEQQIPVNSTENT